MAEIINLRQARKRKARSEKAATAETNRARHGRTKSERQRDDIERTRRETMLDGHRQAPRSDDDETAQP